MPENIRGNSTVDGTEFVLLDYSSPDDLFAWVQNNLSNELQSGRVVYYQAKGFNQYIPAHAKNIAHRLAHSPIVCNLDADNFTGQGFADFLIETFFYNRRRFVHTEGVRGASGRLAFLKRDFEALGGYDEDFQQGWGYDDDDLKNRAIAFGLKPIIIRAASPFLGVIQHDDAERTKYAAESVKEVSRVNHRNISLHQKSPIRNVGRNWGKATLIKNFSETIEI